jgi:predicted transcriptional regulator YdeE
MLLGLLYRPHADDPAAPAEARACFVGVEVTELDAAPAGCAVTRFSGGEYVVVACQGDAPEEAAEGVGQAIGALAEWIRAHGYREGDACFAASHEDAAKPPYIEYVYVKLERGAQPACAV